MTFISRLSIFSSLFYALQVLELRNQLETKEKEIAIQYLKMQQEIKNLEESYKKRFHTYEKGYRDALSGVEALRSMERVKLNRKEDTLDPTPPPEEVRSHAPESSQQVPLNTFINFATSLSPTITSLAGKTKGKEIIQWVVSSTSSKPPAVTIPPRVEQDRVEFQNAALLRLGQADKQRLLARKAWIEYVITCQRYSIKVQVSMTKLQALLESVILVLQDHMRKMIVFESSSLANQQYDIQMLFKAMERIDVRGDLLGLITTHTNLNPFKDSAWCSQIFQGANLSHISSLPPPPVSIPLTFDLSDKPALLEKSQAQSIFNLVLLQPPPDKSPDVFPSLDGLGVYDGTQDIDSGNSNSLEEEKEEGEWYECAEDVLAKLIDLQNQMREYWLNLIEEFNGDSLASEKSINEALLPPTSPGEISEEKGDSDEESPNMRDIRNHLEDSPSPMLIPHDLSNPNSIGVIAPQTIQIMASWGLLDAVQTNDSRSDPFPDLLMDTFQGNVGNNADIRAEPSLIFPTSNISLL